MRIPYLLTGAAALALVPVIGLSQTMSDEELLKLFQDQRSAFTAAKESGIGRTRGLTLVTVDDVKVSTEGPTGLQAPATEGAAGPVATATGEGVSVQMAPLTSPAGQTDQAMTAPSAAETTPVVFGELAPELQINVHITFPFESAALTPDQKPQLAQLCSVMKASTINLFRIAGHTDAAGSDAYNEKLSLLRAKEVQRYMVNECGIDATRLEAIGLGERFLFDKNDPKAGDNRRVEFQALS
jgi:OmpA-OmpF porin, OOP family